MKLRYLLIICCYSFFLQGCLFGDSAEPVQQIEQLDLKPGQQFNYRWTFTMDDGENVFAEEDFFLVTVLDTGATLQGRTNLTVMQAVQVDDTTDSKPTTTTWYRSTEEVFTAIAFQRSGSNPGILPKSPTDTRMPFPFFVPKSVQFLAEHAPDFKFSKTPTPAADTSKIIFRPEPRVVYHFPFLEKQKWTSFEKPFLQTRRIVERRITDVPAGRFPTFSISTQSDFFRNSFTWIDYVAKTGVIKREITFTIQSFDDEGNQLPPRNIRETLELTGLSESTF